ncbi:MAG: PA0069 family radical SAM protein [Pedosphaera sp.]|nr:PA0069 family radical SAM protein [Pedosphaera sp.]
MNPDSNDSSHRGASGNPANRFLQTHREADPDADHELDPAEEPHLRTQFIEDHSQTVLSHNESPDIGFTHSLNPYRGCEHGCIYCYARPTHEYLGYSAGLDFETRIVVKYRAPELLRKELSSPRWKPNVIALSGVTDPYQPVERKLALTRRCLAVLRDFRNPVGIVTKNSLVTRDIDLLGELAHHQAAGVYISLTTLDPALRAVMEPRTSPSRARLRAIRTLAAAGIPVGVMLGPIIPGLTDHEIPRLVEAAADSGAQFAGKVVLRLPHAVAPLFEAWLGQHFPGRKESVLNRIRSLRGGQLNDPNFGTRMTGQGPLADQIQQLFEVSCRKHGLLTRPQLSIAAFRRVEPGQLELL